MIFTALGDSAVLATLGGASGDAALVRVRLLAAALEQASIPGIVDVVPAYGTVAVFYERARFGGQGEPAYAVVCREIDSCAKTAGVEARRLPRRPMPERLIEIPVCYGGDFGADLTAVAEHCRMTPAEVIARHSQGDYRVQALGFVPGFPYLSGLPESLRTPRHASPRASVPTGSVGIGGSQTGVYPLATPGGWQLIGRTPLSLFRPEANPPALLRAGDRVRFCPIAAEEFNRAVAEARRDEPPATALPARGSSGEIRRIRVIRPGLLTTVQDLGRPGYRSAGVPSGGAMDPFALRLANLIVGNPDGAAGLEITLLGPELEFTADTLVAVGGAEFAGAPPWRPLLLRAGERLKFGECRQGCRAYLAVGGGIDVAPALGSRSTYLPGGFGGWAGRALREGDEIEIGAGPPGAGGFRRHLSWRVSPSALPAYSPHPVLRAVRGAQAGGFGAELWETEFQVSPKSDRMGLRLAGRKLARDGAADLPSSAVAPGTVQVPPEGLPILLMADAQTIGGYPQAAHVIGPDLPLAAQLRPGDSVRLSEVSVEDAHRLALARERDLAMVRLGFPA